jgi:hypothetical protein
MRFAVLCVSILALLGLLVLVNANRLEQGFLDGSDGTLAVAAQQQQAPTQPPVANQDFLDKSMWSDKIKNKPAPPGVDFVGEVVYAPVDLAADIAHIKNQLSNMTMNQPDEIRSQVVQQISPLVGSVLRQNGFPMTDETYGLSC